MLRAAGVTGINFANFQDDFDLDKDGGPPKNHFVSVGRAVQAKYPKVNFVCESFAKGKGQDKVARIEELLAKGVPVLVSISNEPQGGSGWHTMPVVDATADEFTLLVYVEQNGTVRTRSIKKADVAKIHECHAGGDDLAYLNVPPAAENPQI